MKVLLTTFNAKYIHKNLALRWLYVSKPKEYKVTLKEYTIKDSVSSVVENMLSFQSEVIAFSVYIWNVQETKEAIRLIKDIAPSTRILLGGPEVTFDNAEWFDLPIEAVIVGEGEFIFWEYLQGKKPTSIQMKKNEIVPVHRESIAKLEELESPYFLDFDLTDIQKRYLYVETSRGCPYGCLFCLSSTDREVRLFSESYLYHLFELINHYQVKQVKFLDRTFNLMKDRAYQMASYLNDSTENTVYQFEIVADTLSEEMISFMCNLMDKNRFRFEVGIQSFHKDTLMSVGRKQDNVKLKEVIKRLQTHQVIMHTDLIAGLPYEDLEGFSDSFEQLFALEVKEIQVGILKLLKGTKLREMVDEYQIEYDDYAPYRVSSTKWMSIEDIEIVEKVYHAVEKCYNNQRLLTTIQYLIQHIKPFEVFKQLGDILKELSSSFVLKTFYNRIYEVFIQNTNTCERDLKGALLMDYYKGTKQRPPKLFEAISHQEKQAILKQLIQDKRFTQNVLYHYAVVEWGYNKHPIYQIVVYNELQEPSLQYEYTSEVNL